MKLWQKDNTDIAQRVEAFTVGHDRDFDLLLAACDVKGSLAHTEMLCKAGLLRPAEKEQVHRELYALLEEIGTKRNDRMDS